MTTTTVTTRTATTPASKRRPADQRPALVYLARLSVGSRRTMRQALDDMARMLSSGVDDAASFDWAALRYQHTTAVRTAILEGRSTRTGAALSPTTVNKMLAALRGVLRESWRLGQMTAEDFQRAADLDSVRGYKEPRGRALSVGEVRALFDACARDDSPAGTRDAALLALLYGAGLRRSELVGLDREDYNAESGALLIRHGKGRKERTVYVANGSRDALTVWLAVRGDGDGALFPPMLKGGRTVQRRMTAHAVLFVLRRRGQQAGVSSFSPHDMRRTFISEMLSVGADLSTIQHLAGHANIATTSRYDRRGEQAKQKAAALLHVPYVRR